MADPIDLTPITNIRHPFYLAREFDWLKWRYVYEGGDQFIERYLQRFSMSETADDFKLRKEITYNPGFAKAAVTEVRNSIYQRLSDIVRTGGTQTYQAAMQGELNGVDLVGSSMNTFMGVQVLEELLPMARVGVYIDMPKKAGPLLANNNLASMRPYLYVYKTEDIRSWDYDDSPTPNRFRALLLRDTIYVHDEATGLPYGTTDRYRFFYKDAITGKIKAKFYNQDAETIDPDTGQVDPDAEFELDIDRIPFVMIELSNSLLADVSNHQIGLLNLASSDMNYCFKANFPFYTEEYDPRIDGLYNKGPGTVSTTIDPDTGGVVTLGTDIPAPSQDIKVGVQSGRRYAKGLQRPGFIAPPAEPLKVSIEKQEQMKTEIRLLINLSIANLNPKMASAGSKMMDERSLESGLSYIGLVMEDGERQIAEIWHLYENQMSAMPSVNYPKKFNLMTDKEVREETAELKNQMSSVPSLTYQKEMAKRIATLVLGPKVSNDTLEQIYKEIDKAKVVDVLVDKIEKDVAGGYLDTELAAELRGYPPGTAEKAQQERIERLKEIQMAQTPGQGAGAASISETITESSTGVKESEQAKSSPPKPGLQNPAARGVPELSPSPKMAAKLEKAAKPVRGPSQ